MPARAIGFMIISVGARTEASGKGRMIAPTWRTTLDVPSRTVLAEVAQIVADFTPKRRANRKISRFFGSENDLRSM